MLKFINNTSNEDFEKLVKQKHFSIEKMGVRTWYFYNQTANKVGWELKWTGHDNDYIIQPLYTDYYNHDFMVYFTSNDNEFIIREFVQDHKHFKSDKYLKKLNDLCLLANAFIKAGFCNDRQ